MELNLRGVVRDIAAGVNQLFSGGDVRDVALASNGDLLTANGGARYEQITASGRAFEANTGNTSSTDVAAVIAYPTTAVGFAIYNGEPDGGRSYVITKAWCASTANFGAALEQVHLIGLVGTVREAAPTDAMPAGALRALNGMGGTDTKVRAILTATALPATTGVAANWFPLASSVNTVVVSLPGLAIVADVDGQIIVPPGRYFALHAVAASVGAVVNFGVRWYEKVLPLG